MGNSNDINNWSCTKSYQGFRSFSERSWYNGCRKFCEEYCAKWKTKIDEAIALVDGPLSNIIISYLFNTPYYGNKIS